MTRAEKKAYFKVAALVAEEKNASDEEGETPEKDNRKTNKTKTEESENDESKKTVSFDKEKTDIGNIFSDPKTSTKRVSKVFRRVNYSQQRSKPSSNTIMPRSIDIFTPETTIHCNVRSIWTPTKERMDDNALNPNLVIDSGEVQDSGEIKKPGKEFQKSKNSGEIQESEGGKEPIQGMDEPKRLDSD